MFINLLLNVGSVFLMMVPGFVAYRKSWVDKASIMSISRIMLYFCYPCLILTSITGNYSLSELISSYMLPTGSAMIMLAGFVVGHIFCRLAGNMDQGQKRSFVFQCTMNNYSFLPMAMIISMFDERLIAPLIVSTLGAELVMWTFGILTISGRKLSWQSLTALLSPPLIGIYLAISVLITFKLIGFDKEILTNNGTPWNYLYNSLRSLGLGTVPLAMTIAGARMAQLKFSDVNNKLVYTLAGLRLILIPLAAIGLLRLSGINGEYWTILLIVAVMPVSLNSLMLNELYGGNRELIAGSVLLTHILSLLTIPTIMYFFAVR